MYRGHTANMLCCWLWASGDLWEGLLIGTWTWVAYTQTQAYTSQTLFVLVIIPACRHREKRYVCKRTGKIITVNKHHNVLILYNSGCKDHQTILTHLLALGTIADADFSSFILSSTHCDVEQPAPLLSLTHVISTLYCNSKDVKEV